MYFVIFVYIARDGTALCTILHSNLCYGHFDTYFSMQNFSDQIVKFAALPGQRLTIILGLLVHVHVDISDVFIKQ